MKNMKKIISTCLVFVMACTMAACGGNATYDDYSKAFKKTASVGSLDVEFDLEVENDDTSVKSTGNMQMNSSNEVYYEMKINGKEIVQYVKDGSIHTFVDGKEMVTSTDDDKGAEKADPDENEEKTEGTSFNTEKFLEEISGMLEAGKIKEMGVLDPIPSKYIKEITEKDGVYTITFPDEFLNTFLDIIVAEQIDLDGTGIEFSKLKNFKCISKENGDGYLNSIQYKGTTTVTVPADLMESGKEETFELDINLKIKIKNPGKAVDVEIPN